MVETCLYHNSLTLSRKFCCGKTVSATSVDVALSCQLDDLITRESHCCDLFRRPLETTFFANDGALPSIVNYKPRKKLAR